ncbi:hypothetical protein Q3G72_015835 [Acer saccharum]|nr:hypothetical protein Q3G72_015835 [Acer saccharum]
MVDSVKNVIGVDFGEKFTGIGEPLILENLCLSKNVNTYDFSNACNDDYVEDRCKRALQDEEVVRWALQDEEVVRWGTVRESVGDGGEFSGGHGGVRGGSVVEESGGDGGRMRRWG